MEQVPPPTVVAPSPPSRLKSGVVAVLKVLYWPAALLQLAPIALSVKILFFEQHDRAYRLNALGVTVVLVALLSAMSILRFKPQWMKAPMIVAHGLLLVLGFLGAAFADRISPHPQQVASAAPTSSTSSAAAPATSGATTDADREFWMYRMEQCRPLVQDAQEIRHQETMLLIIESAVIKDHKLHGNDSSQAKAASALKTISEARSVALHLRSKLSSEKFSDVQPDWFADTLRKYGSMQSKYAFITAERARVLKEYGQSGDTNLLIGLQKVNKELSDNADNALQFEKGFATICFSPPDKKH